MVLKKNLIKVLYKIVEIKFFFIKCISMYDFISLSILWINYDYIYKCIGGKFQYIIKLYFILWLENQLKNYFSTFGWSIFKRPDHAMDCGLLNDGGDVSMKCGFPSGHVWTTTFYCFTNYFENTYSLFFTHVPIVLMMMSRMGKGCHNFIQVVGGYCFGFLTAFFLG